MALNLNRLGNYIEENEIRNSDLKYSLDKVRGISNTKEIMLTKARVEYADLKKFYIAKPGEFVFNPRTSRNGEKIGVVYNYTDTPLLFTFNDVAFRIKEEKKNELSGEYLYLLMKKDSFDRYARYHSWGSATELFTWDDMCNTIIDVPDYEIQKRIVKEYNAFSRKINIESRKIENLKELLVSLFNKDFGEKTPNDKLASIIIQNKKSKIQVSSINKDGKYIFFTSGKKTRRHSEYLVDGLNLFLNTGGTFDVKIYDGKASYSTDNWCIYAGDKTLYLFAMFLSDIEKLNDKYFDGSALNHLKKPQIMNMDCYIPNNEELELFNKKATPIVQTILNSSSIINQLDEALCCILSKVYFK